MKVLFSCQNNQELDDLALVARYLAAHHAVTPVFYDVSNFIGESYSPANLRAFSTHYQGVRLFNRDFKYLHPLQKLITSFINAVNITKICYKNKIRVCVFGVPLLVYRLLGVFIYGQIVTVAYLRGIIVKSTDETSLSSKLFRRLNWISKGPLKCVISDYYADRVLCTGQSTAAFVNSRGVPQKNISTVGSVYCDSRLNSDQNKFIQLSGKKTIVFVSSAFAAHGYIDSQEAQFDFILKIFNFLKANFSSDKVRFLVRKHPRELTQYYDAFCRVGGDLDERGLDALSAYPNDTLFISPVSTLLFELAYLGKTVAMIADDYFLMAQGDFYDAIKTTPEVKWRGLLYDFVLGRLDGRVHGLTLDQVFSTQHRGTVVSDIASLIASARSEIKASPRDCKG